MIVDSHCHLNYKDFQEDFDLVLQRAKQNGVSYMQTISTYISEFPEVLAIAEKYDNIFCSVGLHPCHVMDEAPPSADKIIQLTNHPKVIGIGETGLDYYHKPFDEDLQKMSFQNHIIAAQETGIPLIIHSRDADNDTIEILEEHLKIKDFKFLIHCFTGSKPFAERVLEIGGYISFSGIITFKNAIDLQNIAKFVPLSRILIETDAPYLAPVPFRGKRNEPAYTLHVAEFLSTLKDINLDEVKQTTTQNFRELFNKAKI
ncbi:MAG: TatD family hydrolase [Alphaproteobacteria bacterium]|nr:TatD family hydrolase [Alphaproteobacteria bacterium]OJV15722.1 MAG: hypothetical protein BGO27_07385 [Alphaproteobacteria bacterium 33-17]